MKVKIYTYTAFVLTVVIAIGIKGFSPNEGLSVMAQSNIEALTQTESEYLKVAQRETNTCTVKVGAKGRIQLFNGTIITAGGSGEIVIDGQVTCIGDGSIYCRPIECMDLYKML